MFKHLLVAIAVAEDTDQTLSVVLALAKAFSARVTVFHARERVVAARETREQESIDQSREFGRSMAEQLAAQGVETGFVVEDVRPDRLADHILAHAAKEAVDLIVIGGHHSHSLRESVFGDIGKLLAHRAECPVLMMPST